MQLVFQHSYKTSWIAMLRWQDYVSFTMRYVIRWSEGAWNNLRSRSQPSPKGGRGGFTRSTFGYRWAAAFLWNDPDQNQFDLRSQDHGRSNEPMNPCPVDSSVHLIYYDPSALGSLILVRIISKECTLNVRYLGISVGFPRLSSWETSGLSGKQN